MLINHDSISTLIGDKEFILDFEVEDVNVEEQVLPVSSLIEKNVIKVFFEEISNEHDVSIKVVQFIIDLSFISNDMAKEKLALIP